MNDDNDLRVGNIFCFRNDESSIPYLVLKVYAPYAHGHYILLDTYDTINNHKYTKMFVGSKNYERLSVNA
jgi:hypothetical protein